MTCSSDFSRTAAGNELNVRLLEKRASPSAMLDEGRRRLDLTCIVVNDPSEKRRTSLSGATTEGYCSGVSWSMAIGTGTSGTLGYRASTAGSCPGTKWLIEPANLSRRWWPTSIFSTSTTTRSEERRVGQRL